jgi:hypothetical protein
MIFPPAVPILDRSTGEVRPYPISYSPAKQSTTKLDPQKERQKFPIQLIVPDESEASKSVPAVIDKYLYYHWFCDRN